MGINPDAYLRRFLLYCLLCLPITRQAYDMSQDVLLDLGQHGSLRGTVSLGVTHRYLNIPYGLPPIGERRWRKPTPLPKDFVYTNETHSPARDCTTYGDICLQPPYLVNGKDLSIVPGAHVDTYPAHPPGW